MCFSNKSRELEGRTDPVWGGWYQWEGKDEGTGCRRVNIVQILCIHVCNGKRMRPAKYSSNVGEGVKENDGGGEFSYDIRTCVNVTMYVQ
jgi:hypothetical protein